MRAPASLLAFTAISLIAFTSAPYAQQSARPGQSSQQDRMRSCNNQAAQQKLTGDARKSFMSSCLSGSATSGSTAPSKQTQQDKMKSCNTQASTQNLTGNARKSFMSNCLKGS